ncbi:hypothetical protein Ciccas_008290 [Cichlidogyrus casuarinus]|uniref:Cyclic nucleotide-binding domain-containing protein n=1 Tax=Cichlidogyrus casuarinus TaxID=1844966 RepID=A0ABD2Q0E2_9PLAT
MKYSYDIDGRRVPSNQLNSTFDRKIAALTSNFMKPCKSTASTRVSSAVSKITSGTTKRKPLSNRLKDKPFVLETPFAVSKSRQKARSLVVNYTEEIDSLIPSSDTEQDFEMSSDSGEGANTEKNLSQWQRKFRISSAFEDFASFASEDSLVVDKSEFDWSRVRAAAKAGREPSRKYAFADVVVKVLDEDKLEMIDHDRKASIRSEDLELAKETPDKIGIPSTDNMKTSNKNALSILLRFKRIILLSLIMRRLQSIIRVEKPKRRLFIEIDQEISRNEQTMKFNFSKSMYRAIREPELSSEAKDTLQLPPEYRTDPMIRKTMLALMNIIEAYGEFPLKIRREMVRLSTFEEYGPQRSTGEAYEETIAFLRRGSAYGELALMYGGKRNATITSKTPVQLLALSKGAFLKIFMNLRTTTQEPDHIRFLRTVKHLPKTLIDALPYDDASICLYSYFRKGMVLCKDNNVNDWIYIVMDGCGRLCMTVSLPSKRIDPEILDKSSPRRNLREKEKRPVWSFAIKTSVELANEKQEERAASVAAFEKSRNRPVNRAKSAGLETVAFSAYGPTGTVMLISDGLECVAIKKSFLLKHSSTQFSTWLKRKVQPLPSNNELNSKLDDWFDWQEYRQRFISSLRKDRKIRKYFGSFERI